jgi:tripartite ATP-independent transporter DctM subunit
MMDKMKGGKCNMTSIEIGALGIVVLLILTIFFKFPVSIALITVGLIGNIMMVGLDLTLHKFGGDLIVMIQSYNLSVIPLFVLMGLFISKSGIAQDLYDALDDILVNVRGGMAIATLGAGGAFASVCGSATASASTFASVAAPEMIRHNYNPGFSAAVVAVGSTLGVLIPPSTQLVLYGVVSEEPIGKVLVGGFLPGIMTMFMLMITAYIMIRIKPSLAPIKGEKRKKSFRKLLRIWPVPTIFLISIGGIYAGYFTPTEAGAVGAFFSFFFALITRRLNWSNFWEAVSYSVRITGMVFLIIIGGKMFGVFLTRSLLPKALATYILSLEASPFIIVLLIIFIYTIMGFFMDELATLVIMTPIMYPIIISLGFDGVWFGVLTTMMLLSGLLTPPVGVVSLVVSAVLKLPTPQLAQMYKYQIPFWGTLVLAAIICVIFPDIILYLPNLMY